MKWILALAIGLGAGLADCQGGPLGIFGRSSCASGQCGVSAGVVAPAPVANTPAPVASPTGTNVPVEIRHRVRARQRLIFRGRLRRGC